MQKKVNSQSQKSDITPKPQRHRERHGEPWQYSIIEPRRNNTTEKGTA